MDHYCTQWLDDNYIAMRRAIEANSVTRRATSIGQVHNSAGESYFHIVIPTELDQEYKGERTYAWTQADIIPDLTDHIITVITIDDDVDFSKTKTTYDLVKNAFASQSFDLDTPWEEVASWISQNLVTKLTESTRQNKYKKLTLEEAKKVLEDKIRLVGEMKRQAEVLCKSGRCNRWYQDMIAATIVSIIGMLSREFYSEYERYIEQIKELKVLPINQISMKARLINISPMLAVKLLHLKNSR